MARFKIRPAQLHESAALTALMLRSKAYWGYDAAFMQQCEASFAIPAELIARGYVQVVEDETGATLGVASIVPLPDDGDFDLLHMFVEPSAIGSGAGRVLFEAILRTAREAAAHRLVILSDPHAAAFYEKMGAVRIGDAPSDAIPGRQLPLLTFKLT